MKSAQENSRVIAPSSIGRIAPVDGLRAVAVLGVLWAHIWGSCGSPSLSLGHLGRVDVDLNRLLMMGTGVDLFFVISGFCMYLMYARKQTYFELGAYKNFLLKRWLRIAPAYYVAILFYSLRNVANGQRFPIWDALSHTTFTGTGFTNPGHVYAPFVSLATEWQFYLILPLFIAAVARFNFRRVVTGAGMLSLSCLLLYYVQVIKWPLSDVTQANITYQVSLRFTEFLWGICVAQFFRNQKHVPLWLYGNWGVFASFFVVLVGRALSLSKLLNASHGLAPLVHALSLPLLSFGYACALWNVIGSKSVWSRLLSTQPVQVVGRGSYSLYLWHGAVFSWVTSIIRQRFGLSGRTPHLSFWTSLLLLMPISWLSHSLLEVPYISVFSDSSQKCCEGKRFGIIQLAKVRANLKEFT